MSNEWEPVLTVETEPDYWSGGHSYEGDEALDQPNQSVGLTDRYKAVYYASFRHCTGCAPRRGLLP